MSRKEEKPVKPLSLTIVVTIVASIFILDQWTKFLAVEKLAPVDSIEVIPGFFSLTFVQNKGAAFGMFAGLPSPWREVSLGVVSVIALGFVIHIFITEAKEQPLLRIALSMILGGAFGNLLDRARAGAVVDFLDFYVSQYHFAAFNVADSSICVGVALLFWSMSRAENSKKREQSKLALSEKNSPSTLNT
jgi:signal peptidase II